MPRIPIPDEFSGPFAVGAGLHAGLTPARLRGSDLQRPFWGVRVPAGEALDCAGMARAYAVRMPAHAFFSHATAAQLHGIPLPLRLIEALPLDVGVPEDRTPPGGSGAKGHRLAIAPVDVIVRRGLRLTSLERTLCDLSALLDEEELLAAGDNILWRRRLRGHRATVRSLEEAIERFHGRRGLARLTRVVPLMTDRADSPPESVIRLRLIRAGLPELLVNEQVCDAIGAPIATPDLQIPRYRMALDYEGDHHRTDPRQWRKDLARVPLLQDAGWHHTRISADDLADSSGLVARLRRRLRERGWTG